MRKSDDLSVSDEDWAHLQMYGYQLGYATTILAAIESLDQYAVGQSNAKRDLNDQFGLREWDWPQTAGLMETLRRVCLDKLELMLMDQAGWNAAKKMKP